MIQEKPQTSKFTKSALSGMKNELMRSGVLTVSFMKTANISNILHTNLEASREVHNRLIGVCMPAVTTAADALVSAYCSGHKALFFRNGGSAADARYLATEFLGRYLRQRRPLSVLSLNVNSSAVTAIGNDFGYDRFLARQLEVLAAGGRMWIQAGSTVDLQSSNPLTPCASSDIASLRVQSGQAGLDGQAEVPALFLFPCPVARGWAVFVYCHCYGNICDDTYHADALAITSLRGRGKMNRRLSLLLFVVMLGFPGFIQAQSASGIIAPARMINWSQAGVVGGIPNRSTVCTTLSPGASASQINSAIASCQSGQVVLLNAGTYNLSSGIDFAGHSNVTLRGAGSDKTFLVFSGYANCNGLWADVCMEGSNNWQGGPANTANWTAGYSKGTTQITLDNTSNLRVGSVLILDQLDDTSDTGGVFVCQTQGVCSSEGPGGSGRPNRAQEQLVQVQAISGNTVTITPGLYMSNWSASKSPGAWWANSTIANDGLEDVSLDHSGSGAQSGITLYGAVNCWVENVRDLNSNRNHIWLDETIHSTIRDSYFYGTRNAASQSYGVEFFMTSDDLVENNIFQHITSPMQGNGSMSGTVVSYNYAIDDYYAAAPTYMAPAQQMHSGGIDMTLFEGNVTDGFYSDEYHGTENLLTLFRNRFLGWETGQTGNTVAVHLTAWSRYFNVVGNVLGEPSYSKTYTCAATCSNSAASIYTLGDYGTDPLTESSLLRWGNYDVVTSGVRWDTSEVPSSLTQYANPVPSSQSLPASFFLSAKPGWWNTPWGNPPWPAIGPDVTGGSGPGGHSYEIPAELCYNNTSKDSSGILNFDAKSCYSSSPAPAPPTNLGAVAH